MPGQESWWEGNVRMDVIQHNSPQVTKGVTNSQTSGINHITVQSSLTLREGSISAVDMTHDMYFFLRIITENTKCTLRPSVHPSVFP